MSDATATSRYTRVAIILHWLIAVFILFNLAIGFFMEGLPPAIMGIVIPLHISAGLSVLVLTVVRVFWRLTHQPPAHVEGMKGSEINLANIVHFLLYAGMVLMPLTGWALISANPPAGTPGAEAAQAAQAAKAAQAAPPPGGAHPPVAGKGGAGGHRGPPKTITVWGVLTFPWLAPVHDIGAKPEGLGAQHGLHDDFKDWHEVGAFVMILLLLLHVAGALKHQLIDKQPELARMGIGKGRAKDFERS